MSPISHHTPCPYNFPEPIQDVQLFKKTFEFWIGFRTSLFTGGGDISSVGWAITPTTPNGAPVE